MCLGIPGKIISLDEDNSAREGTVDFGGVTREVCLACVPDATVGDYVLVHVGFAIGKIDEKEALATIGALRRLGLLKEELGPRP